MAASMNWVDYIILAIFVLSVIAGFGRGLVKEIVSIVTLIAAFVIATLFSSQLATAFTSSSSVQNAVGQTSSTPVTYAALGVSFALLFLATVIVGCFIGFLLNLIFKAGILGIGNRILGALFGLVRGFLINLVIIFVIQLTAFSTQPWWKQSQLVPYFEPTVERLGAIVSPTLSGLKEELSKTMENVNSSMQKGGANQSKSK
jgi:membrane protein required for colicin V production